MTYDSCKNLLTTMNDVKNNVDVNLDMNCVVKSLSTMRLTAIALFLSLCGLHSVESFKFSRDLSIINNITPLNIKLNNAKNNPDVDLDTAQLIRKAGYPVEVHVVLTEDGYLLKMHRIPGGKNSSSVLLQHGLLCSSADWIILGKDKALAFILADQGYDVWLGNFRGNTYSRAHISLSPSDSKFWDFSFHEMGIYDLPAMISFITNMTSQLLHTYIGYSMGTTTFYVMASERPEIAKKVRMKISLAPIAFVGNIKSPLRLLSPLSSFRVVTRFLDEEEFVPRGGVVQSLIKYGCDIDLFGEEICSNIMFVISGFDRKQFNYTLLPVILGHTPASTSTRTLLHYSQGVNSDKFRAYDFGKEKNLRIYNATLPPDYDLSSITVPIALIYANNDWLATEKDVSKLRSLLTNIVDDYKVPYPKFNHVDFLWAKDANKLVYEKVVEIMKKKIN